MKTVPVGGGGGAGASVACDLLLRPREHDIVRETAAPACEPLDAAAR